MDTLNFTAADRYSMIANDRRRAVADRIADRQRAHDAAASARAAEKRAKKRHEIATRPRGVTEIVGRHEDGRPIYRTIPAFRARPYTPPADRKERPAPSTAHGIAAALKAEAPHNALSSHKVLADLVDSADDRRRFLGIATSRVAKRIARKAANRRKARRGWR